VIKIGIALNLIWIACAVYYGIRCERLEGENRWLRRVLKQHGLMVAVASESIAEGDFVRVVNGAARKVKVAA
jgi:hypothetical protein